MSLPRLYDAAEVAEAVNETKRYVEEQCRRGIWPHRRLARGRIAFTADDYAAVLDLIAVRVDEPMQTRWSFAPRSRRGSAA